MNPLARKANRQVHFRVARCVLTGGKNYRRTCLPVSKNSPLRRCESSNPGAFGSRLPVENKIRIKTGRTEKKDKKMEKKIPPPCMYVFRGVTRRCTRTVNLQ